jgi:lysozyme
LQKVFDEDFDLAWANANSLVKERLTNTDFELLDIDRKMKIISIFCNMCFQLGKAGVGKFRKMFENIAKLNFKGASLEMLDSRWAKQTPSRAEYLSNKMSQV